MNIDEASVSLIVIGVITTPRVDVSSDFTLRQLRMAGFTESIHVFCEPLTAPCEQMPGVSFHSNSRQMCSWGNWRQCLHFLVENFPNCRHFLVCEDDVAFCPGARRALFAAFASIPTFGFLSLYTPKRDAPHASVSNGWFEANHGRKAWGAQAMCFSNESALMLLQYPRVQNEDPFSGPTDTIVSECFLVNRVPCFYHNPSLCDHVGKHSTIGHEWYDAHTGLDFDPHFG